MVGARRPWRLRLHDHARQHGGVARAADDPARPRCFAHPARVGRERLHAGLCRGSAHGRQARGPRRTAADLRRRPRRLHGELARLRARRERRGPGRRAGRAGYRRRPDAAGDAVDHHRDVRGEGARYCDRCLGRTLGRRARDRPDDRRRARPARRLGMDLLHQHSGRRGRHPRHVQARPGIAGYVCGETARRAGPGYVGARHLRPQLRADPGELLRLELSQDRALVRRLGRPPARVPGARAPSAPAHVRSDALQEPNVRRRQRERAVDVHRALHLHPLLLDLLADGARLLGRPGRGDVPRQQRRDPHLRAGGGRSCREDRATAADGGRDGDVRGCGGRGDHLVRECRDRLLRRPEAPRIRARRDVGPGSGGSTMTAAAAERQPQGRPIPGPRGHPILGSIREIQRDNVQAFMDAWLEYGDIVHFRGPLTINLLVHPDYVERVLRDNVANYPRPGFVTDKLKSIVGEGLVAAEGDRWANARRVAQPAFAPERINGFGPTMIQTTGEMLERWSSHAERGEPLDIKSEMMHISLANLATALFNFDLREALDEIEPAVYYALSHTNRRLTSPIDPQRLPLPSTRRFNATLNALNQVIYRITGEHRKATDATEDFVNLLLDSQDPESGAAITDRQARDEVIGFFIAGHETVSSALTWTFYLLSQNPDCWRKLKAEVDEVLGGRTPTVDDVPNLKYTEYVLLEAMRHYPPIFVLMRRALEDDTVGGYHIPKDSTVVLCSYVTHRHPDFWENPEGFDPDRFTPERSAGLPRMAYFPYGGGPRKCIGNTFAALEMPLVVAMVTQRYRLDLVPGQVVFPEPAISLRPRDPLMMTLERVSSGGG